MRLLSEIGIQSGANRSAIQLLQGDCTSIPPEHDADILVVSAFPNDYTALPGSLMRALLDKGIDVRAMAVQKAVDLVSTLGCWLSQPLSEAQQKQFHFKRILCYELTRESGAPEAVVGNIFRCINNFVFDDENNVIAMPLLATGKQRVPMETMLPAMLEACIFWLESGIPLDCIKLIVKDEVQAGKALPLFEQIRLRHARAGAVPAMPGRGESPSPVAATRDAGDGGAPAAAVAETAASAAGTLAQSTAAPVATEFDFFISYSHVQTAQVAELVQALRAKNSQFQIFYDRSSIPPGGQWIRQISEAIQRSKCVVCILSPQYRTSDVCWDEFQCAKAKEYRTKKSLIKTINFLQDADMPLIMSVYSYIDCTEGDLQKLRDSVSALAANCF